MPPLRTARAAGQVMIRGAAYHCSDRRPGPIGHACNRSLHQCASARIRQLPLGSRYMGRKGGLHRLHRSFARLAAGRWIYAAAHGSTGRAHESGEGSALCRRKQGRGISKCVSTDGGRAPPPPLLACAAAYSTVLQTLEDGWFQHVGCFKKCSEFAPRPQFASCWEGENECMGITSSKFAFPVAHYYSTSYSLDCILRAFVLVETACQGDNYFAKLSAYL